MFKAGWVFALVPVVAASAAWAGEVPLYQPASAWVVPAQLPGGAALAGDASPNVLLDLQQRLENGQLSSYVDSAWRVASPEMLAQLATITIPWAPDKGDMIVHELSIQRAGERIDLLAKGQKFTVLRREQALEQRELTGILTATLAVEGLQVGDILRLRLTTTAKDQALGGRVQSTSQLAAEPARLGQARMRFSWPVNAAPKWKILAAGVTATPVRKGNYAELALTLPIAKQPEMPADAPPRYLRPPLIELSTFADWADVSKVMAPLYATDGTIAADSALAKEVAAIMAADATPIGRAQRALQLVQDKIRYLAVGMDGGNYVPQTPVRTWDVRYGDCKAKTLLLLALLHAMKIDAEPVLAHVGLGDLVPDRLPSAAAFNHVFVRAQIGGDTLWLDGTGSGTRLADMHDTPPLRTVLPIRLAGANLMTITTHANARPLIDLSIDADESASTDIPTVFDAKVVVRGPLAAQLALANAQFGDKQRRQAVAGFFQGFFGEAQLSSASITSDPDAGTVTLAGRGVRTTLWYDADRKRKRGLALALSRLNFAPDRGRPAWNAIPAAADQMFGMHYRLQLRLPDDGRGVTIEGDQALKTLLAGHEISRSVEMKNGIVMIDERLEGTGAEIPAPQIPAERDKVAIVLARAPVITAAADTRRRWDLTGSDPRGATQMAAAEAIFTQAIANDPDEMTVYQSRASFRAGIGNRKGALADLTQAIKLAPSVDLYLRRAGIAYELGDAAAALADAQAARAIDPGSADAIGRIGFYLGERGELARAVAMLDERIALGGETKADFEKAKADLIGQFGDPVAAVKLFDGLISAKPGSPSLLNGRCWTKATRNVMLDSALKVLISIES